MRGDAGALGRAIGNLVDNALRHGPAEGVVFVEVSEGDGHAHLAVSDEGEGLQGEDAQHAFERFWRGSGSDRPPGSGLGLAIVRATAERHGGSVRVEGAMFTLTLPSVT